MSLRRRYKPDAEIDMGPFADIAFLLIIFFILTTSLMRPMGRLMDVPSVQQNENKQEDDDQFTITIAPDKLLVGTNDDNMKTRTINDLRDDLFAMELATKPGEDRMIIVNVAENVEYERFYRVVTSVSNAGGIVTLIEEETEEGGES